MEPRIQYAKTADGVSIAYWTLGEGTPLVHLPPIPFGHAHIEWQFPEFRSWYERLAKRRMLVRYDGRGSGLSERNVADFSLDARLLEIESVVALLNLSRFAIFGPMGGGTVAIAYAAKYPERVSHLILWNTVGQPAKWLEEPGIQEMWDLAERNWELAMETYAHMMQGWAESEAANRIAAWFRESITPEIFRTAWRTQAEFDVSNQLAQVKAPTLVLNRPGVRGLDVSKSRALASRLADARLVFLEGTAAAWYLGDTDAVLHAIDEFLGEADEPAADREMPAAADVRTILFTDMESSTALRQQLGDAKAQELLRTHNTIVREALKSHSGSEIKHTGDGIMASFPSASSALECAVAIQRAVAAYVEKHPETPLGVYIGLNAGEPIAEEHDLFGTSVDLARRICDHAQPSEILASDVVRQLAAGKGFLFSDRGGTELRGFEDPVRPYEVRWRET